MDDCSPSRSPGSPQSPLTQRLCNSFPETAQPPDLVLSEGRLDDSGCFVQFPLLVIRQCEQGKITLHLATGRCREKLCPGRCWRDRQASPLKRRFAVGTGRGQVMGHVKSLFCPGTAPTTEPGEHGFRAQPVSMPSKARRASARMDLWLWGSCLPLAIFP